MKLHPALILVRERDSADNRIGFQFYDEEFSALGPKFRSKNKAFNWHRRYVTALFSRPERRKSRTDRRRTRACISNGNLRQGIRRFADREPAFVDLHGSITVSVKRLLIKKIA